QTTARTIYTNAADGIDLSKQGYAIKAHIVIAGASSLTILGEPGTMLVMKDPTASGIWLERCDDVVVNQITIDYDPLPFTQGRIVAANASKKTFDWKVDTGYAEPTQGYLGLQFGAANAPTGRGLGFGNVFTADGAMKFGACGGSTATFAAMTGLGSGVYRAQIRQA